MSGDDRDDQFNDLFEPFELADTPTAEQMATPPPADIDEPFAPTPPPPATKQDEPTHEQSHVAMSDAAAATATAAIGCPSCGARNAEYNHHCERCGSRLSQDPMPIAPAPSARTSAGNRALGVLAAVVLLVALIALAQNIFTSDSGETIGPTETTSTATTVAPIEPVELFATDATASSQIGKNWGPENLIDGNPDTRWNDDSQKGIGAWLRFTFARPVQITEIELQNVTDETKFKQNYKINGFTIEVNDLNVPIPGRLRNSNEPQRIKVASFDTIWLQIEVTTTHPGEPVLDQAPFDELALEGIRFFGVEK